MTDLVVSQPTTRTAERDYIAGVLLREFMGIDYSTEPGPDGVVTIRRPGDPATTLTMADVFFAVPDERWLHPSSLPARPLTSWNVRADLPETTRCADFLPVLYPGPPHAPVFQQDTYGIRVN